jgi:hypothetical protein
MYISRATGVTVYQGQLYSLAGSDLTITTGGSKNSPPKKKLFKAATQEVLKGLYEMGHKGIDFVPKFREEEE